MRILQIAPLWESVPPPAYGGTEAVISSLTKELVRRGHEVTLCAAGDSLTPAELLSVYPHSLRAARDIRGEITDPWPYIWLHVSLSLKEAGNFDIIHNHDGELVMAMSHLVPDVPMLTTMHCLITPDAKFVWDSYQGYYNTISYSQRRLMPLPTGGKFAGVVYNGIDVDTFPFEEKKDEYLLFLSRISPDKMPHLAAQVARRVGMPLIIAGKVDRVDQRYFQSMVAPFIDGKQIKFLGEADARLKRELFSKAYCLLMPICWDEPFGLVLVEAMACGTPVIAFNRGSAPELIVDGETGYIVADVEEMAQAVHRIDRIDPHRCRRHAEQNFDAPIMADRYLELYERILAWETPRPEPVPTALPSPDTAAVA
ncbi:MAG: glycosyltransferase family 4 protein [Dehalococcoidia bacterium]